jgi:hypothetical protein
VTLGHIEHEILRKTFDDPRIHFAIVCASSSCPALRAEAYRFDILERQLHEQTIAFINDPKRGVRWDKAKKRLYVSKIFKWFGEDFEVEGHGVDHYLARYVDDDKTAEALRSGRLKIRYLEYDWSLNGSFEARSEK